MASTTDRLVAAGLLLALGAAGLAGCMNFGPDGEGSTAVFVKDAPVDDLSSVFMTFSRVEIHRAGGTEAADDENEDSMEENETGNATGNETGNGTGNQTGGNETNATEPFADENETEGVQGGWVTVVTTPQTVDLLNLTGDARAFLGGSTLEAGRFTQVRLYIDEAWGIRASDGSRVEIDVPSDQLRLNHPFEVRNGQTTVLTVDFDLERSIHERGGANASAGGGPGGQAGGNASLVLRPVASLEVEIVAMAEAPEGDEGNMTSPNASPTGNTSGNATPYP